MKNRPIARRSQGGFTLLEIAVVLLIAGLLVATGIGVTTSLVENARNRATRSNMESVKLALEGFISRNGRLPCPAVEATAPAAAAYGIEAATPGTCTGTVDLPVVAGVEAAKRGVVPWKTLGMTLENASDGWSNQLTYMVTTSATGKSFETLAGTRGSLYVHSTTPIVAGLPATGNQINACSTTANDNRCNKAAVVILISHGRNGAGAYTRDGVRSPLPAGAAEIENTNADRFVVNAEPSSVFDDILLPLTPDDLLAPLAAQGTIKSERAMLQDRARQVVIQMIGEVVPTQTGTSPNMIYTLPNPTAGLVNNYVFETGRFNTSCDGAFGTNGVAIATIGDVTGDALQILDPWGRTFKFGRATAQINSAESCSTPVAIISLGADGVAGNDDYVYYSPMAEWKEILGKAGW